MRSGAVTLSMRRSFASRTGNGRSETGTRLGRRRRHGAKQKLVRRTNVRQRLGRRQESVPEKLLSRSWTGSAFAGPAPRSRGSLGLALDAGRALNACAQERTPGRRNTARLLDLVVFRISNRTRYGGFLFLGRSLCKLITAPPVRFARSTSRIGRS